VRSTWNLLRWLNILPDEEDGERAAEKERERIRAEEKLRTEREARERELKAARAALAAYRSDELTLEQFMRIVVKGESGGERED
jgi:hypothetical protein